MCGDSYRLPLALVQLSLSLSLNSSFCFPHYVSCVFFNLSWNLITLPPFTWRFYASSVWIVCSDSTPCIYISVSQPDCCITYFKNLLNYYTTKMILNQWLPVLFLVFSYFVQKYAHCIKTVIPHDISAVIDCVCFWRYILIGVSIAPQTCVMVSVPYSIYFSQSVTMHQWWFVGRLFCLYSLVFATLQGNCKNLTI